ncbi:uncharacterized protein TRUGW13939_06775 [Talaromyces rugulosus]|uniref:Uncharacterized protein n=1 Tax=Talaromyces rugulosus TaxID=121627 RepID=A0A7H8R0Z0_TALRU|nr:uncharacterized protein TRUGW13939_06775 [Talaromyces rugulosus]QKX59638.1 hypothetical protein TRUGW13939_06775 [Talaromyces rugulosus]
MADKSDVKDGFAYPSRPLSVIVVGAGISGIMMAIKLQENITNLSLTIYDKNPELGGTWWENRYPGCACDIPAHTYQLSFDSNRAWSTYYASAGEILQYWKRVAEKYDVRKLMKFRHRLTHAQWNQLSSQWEVMVDDELTGFSTKQCCDVLITAMGALNQWNWPSITGLHDFQGKLMHSADWDSSYDLKVSTTPPYFSTMKTLAGRGSNLPQGKKVAVIGAGSSGIQIVPSIQPEVERLDHYVRGRTWIASSLASEEIEDRGEKTGNFIYSQEEISAWQKDPTSYLDYRKRLENAIQGGFEVTAKGSQAHEQAREVFKNLMADRLSDRPDLFENLIPSFAPFCKRLTPGPGYLESLSKENVDVTFEPIDHISKTGIVTRDGKLREVDAIICATGFNTSFTNRFPIYGKDGQKLFEKKSNDINNLSTYLSITVDEFPNFFMMLGPNSGLGHGNLLIILEQIAKYCAKTLSKMQRENIASMEPRKSAVHGFARFCDEFFQGRVFSDECPSWYKTNDRVTALWPGSSLHAVQSLENPRWEDFRYIYVNEKPTSWLGNGTTAADNDPNSDKSYYLTSLAQIQEDL